MGQTLHIEDKRPVWRFQSIDYEGPFACATIEPTKLQQVVKRMGSFETMPWYDIDGKTGSHPISKGDLCKEARDRLTKLKQDDVDELYSLRIDGKERVYGIRDRWIFKILWWDPEHQICPSHKKHT